MKKNKKYLEAAKLIKTRICDDRNKFYYCCPALVKVKQSDTNFVDYFKPYTVCMFSTWWPDIYYSKNVEQYQLARQLALLFLYEMGVD